MGTRAQVKLLMFGSESPLYFYRHWDGDCLIDTVFASIASDRGIQRATDNEYLSRIIFEDMINEPATVVGARSYLGEETGYGIGTSQHGDIEYLITVDPEHQVVTWEHLGWDSINKCTEADAIDQFTFSEIVNGKVNPPRMTDDEYAPEPPAPQIVVIDGKRYVSLNEATPEQQATIDAAIALLSTPKKGIPNGIPETVRWKR